MMIDKNILVITNFPIINPIHGGQKRARAIIDHYKKIYKNVENVSVFYKKNYADFCDNDLYIKDKRIISAINSNPFQSDLALGEAIIKDKNISKKLKKIIETYKPDIVQVEEIYLYEGLVKLLADMKLQPKIILSIYNIEYDMKIEIINNKIDSQNNKEYLNKIEKIEKKAISGADVVLSVSESDAKKSVLLGSRRTIIIPNGIDRVSPTNEAVKHWQKFKKSDGFKKTILFVGSAHPPNWQGFNELIGDDLTFLHSEEKLLIAGGVSINIQQKYGFYNNDKEDFWSKASPLGYLSEDNLAGLLTVCDVILLPIVTGGGSNLKTAEALLSGKIIVATRFAFRSFEKYMELPNIYLEDNPDGFKRMIRAALGSTNIQRTNEQRQLVEEVLWENCFKSYDESIEYALFGWSYVYYTKIKIVIKNLWLKAKHI